MPTVEFNIGHKSYELACQEGEERLHLLMVDDHIPAGAKLY